MFFGKMCECCLDCDGKLIRVGLRPTKRKCVRGHKEFASPRVAWLCGPCARLTVEARP